MEYTKSSESCGAYRQGNLEATYNEIVDVLGEPNTSDGYKVDGGWCIKFEDGTIATIYNYKNGKDYLGEKGLPIEEL